MLENGDTIYRNEGYTGHITLEELPVILSLGGAQFSVIQLLKSENETTKVFEISDNANNGEVFLDNTFLDNLHASDGVIIVMNDFMFMVEIESKFIYLFDSHSRDIDGIPFEEGKSVVLKFKDIAKAKDYLMHVHLRLRNKTKIWFQLQFLNASHLHIRTDAQ